MARTTLKRHPIRGFVWGLVTGAGVGLLLMVLSVVPLSIPTLGVYTAAAAVLGAVWGTIGPPKKPKGATPGPGSEPPPPIDDGSDVPAAT
jgi:hypothetical protein